MSKGYENDMKYGSIVPETQSFKLTATAIIGFGSGSGSDPRGT